MKPVSSITRGATLALETAGVLLRRFLVEPVRKAPPLPRAMHYISTHRCNARCVMCGIWAAGGREDEDLTVAELETLLDDPLFERMQYVGISGGEPFLRRDLPDVVSVFLTACRRLRRVSLTSNGLLPAAIRRVLPDIATRTADARVLLDVSISMHGLGDTLDTVYGVPGAFRRMQESLDLLEAMRRDGVLSFSLNCVLLGHNLDQARQLDCWAADRGIPISFVVGEERPRFHTDGLEASFVSKQHRAELVRFLRDLAGRPEERPGVAMKYSELADIVAGDATRSLSCYYAMGGLLLGHDGRLYYCSHSRSLGSCRSSPPHRLYYDPESLRYRQRALIAEECTRCPPYTRTRWELQRDLPQLAWWTLRRWWNRPTLGGGAE